MNNDINQIIANRHEIIKSIWSSIESDEKAVPTISQDQFEDFSKGHEIFTPTSISKYVKDIQDEFLKALDSEEVEVDTLKADLDKAQSEISTLEKAFVTKGDEVATIFYRKKA